MVIQNALACCITVNKCFESHCANFLFPFLKIEIA